jgi:2-hydroxy-6-oxonona-2,4-dienedioate hydrolase
MGKALSAEARRIFAAVAQSAERLDRCEPSWLRNEEEPRFETVETGQVGPEVVLLHGLLGALSNWDAVLPLFGAFCRPIALEFPLLSFNRSEVKITSLAAYAEYFIRQRGFAPVTLCGNSLGGHVALRICLASPELVDCLILTGTSGLYEHSVDALPVRPDRAFVRSHMKRVFADDRFATDEAVEEISKILESRSNVLNLIHAARSAKKDNLLSRLGRIGVPTLLLWGEEDQITTMDVAHQFHRHIPHSKLVTVKRCGHAPMIEQPEWFANEVEKFLKEHSRHYRKKIEPEF